MTQAAANKIQIENIPILLVERKKWSYRMTHFTSEKVVVKSSKDIKFCTFGQFNLEPVWPEKNQQMSIKVA